MFLFVIEGNCEILVFNGPVVKSGFGVPCVAGIKCFLHLAIVSSGDCPGWSLERQMLPRSVGRLQRKAQAPVADGVGGARIIINKPESLTV